MMPDGALCVTASSLHAYGAFVQTLLPGVRLAALIPSPGFYLHMSGYGTGLREEMGRKARTPWHISHYTSFRGTDRERGSRKT